MNALRALRRRIMTPNRSATSLVVRGFHDKSPEARTLLETIGGTFLDGYGFAAQARMPAAVEAPLAAVPVRFRGFGYEGAAMAFAVRDALRPGGGRNVERFLAGAGADHVYMAYVGVGWAMARLPRIRWSTLHSPDPVLRWLVLDGYGFHQAYFRTERYVYDRYEDASLPWRGVTAGDYARRAIDQGIGRALWFVGGTDVEVVASLVERYPPGRRADLYSGIGLAATYAGGATEAELTALWDHAKEYRPQLAQGSAFGAGARAKANLVCPHNEMATQILCGQPVALARKITDEALVDLPADGTVPAYEVWRQRISEALAQSGHFALTATEQK
jgi:enediyne biosynthesis protein E3